MAWDPVTYLRFEAERTRPAVDLLARVMIEAPASVVDLGCGTGNSTALLARRWPNARLEGIDSSPEMLAKARLNPFAATWTEADIAQWSPDSAPDVIFTNATLQWLPGHATLLPRLFSLLKDGGVFAMQVPRNAGEPLHAELHAMEKDARWKDHFKQPIDWRRLSEPSEYFAMLEPFASHIDIWQTEYLQVLEGEDAVFNWISGTGLRPYLNALEGDARDSFVAEYRARMARIYPSRASGKTLLPFKRLFLVARR